MSHLNIAAGLFSSFEIGEVSGTTAKDAFGPFNEQTFYFLYFGEQTSELVLLQYCQYDISDRTDRVCKTNRYPLTYSMLDSDGHLDLRLYM